MMIKVSFMMTIVSFMMLNIVFFMMTIVSFMMLNIVFYDDYSVFDVEYKYMLYVELVIKNVL
jgi:hypothetical protein